MTREEIRTQTIAQLERISRNLASIGETQDWTEYAIRALEQEPILDKVKQAREKIDEMSRYTSVTGVTQYKQLNRDDVLEILDELIESEGRGMTKEQFIYALTACGCLLKDGKTWYEHNELIKCFEDLGLFKQENKNCYDCEIVQACVEAGIRSTSRALDILDRIRAEIEAEPYVSKMEVLDILDKYKAEQER